MNEKRKTQVALSKKGQQQLEIMQTKPVQINSNSANGNSTQNLPAHQQQLQFNYELSSGNNSVLGINNQQQQRLSNPATSATNLMAQNQNSIQQIKNSQSYQSQQNVQIGIEPQLVNNLSNNKSEIHRAGDNNGFVSGQSGISGQQSIPIITLTNLLQKNSQNNNINHNSSSDAVANKKIQEALLAQMHSLKPNSGTKIKRLNNIHNNLNGVSRNYNQFQNNLTQNAIIYSKNESPYKEMILNKTQEIRGNSNLNRNKNINNMQRKIQQYGNGLDSNKASQQISNSILIVNKSVLNQLQSNNQAQQNYINANQVNSGYQNINLGVSNQTNDSTNNQIQPLILKSALVQRQSSIVQPSQGRLSKSPLQQDIKNDKKLQKIHNIYLNQCNPAQNQHSQQLILQNGASKDYPGFQSQQITSTSSNTTHNYAQPKRKIKPSTAGNPSSSSKQYLMSQSNNNGQVNTIHNGVVTQQNFLPYNDAIKARSKSPQKLIGLPKFSQQLSQTPQTNNTSSQIDEYSQLKNIDNLFAKKKYSLQPPSSGQINPLVNRGISEQSRNASEQALELISIINANQSQKTQQQYLKSGKNLNFIDLSDQQKNQIFPSQSSLNQTVNDTFLIKKHSMRSKFADKSHLLQTQALTKSISNEESLNKSGLNGNQQQFQINKPHKKQSKLAQIEHIKLGTREDARDKLLKLLQRTKNITEQNSQSANTSSNKSNLIVYSQVQNGIQNVASEQQLREKETLKLGEKMNKTQNYNIQKIMLNDQDSLEEIPTIGKVDDLMLSAVSSHKNTLKTQNRYENNAANDQIIDPKDNMINQEILNQILSTPQAIFMAPSDDFSEIENPESVIKTDVENPSQANTNGSSNQVSEFIVDSLTAQQKRQQIQNLIVEEMQPLYYFNVKPKALEDEIEEDSGRFNDSNNFTKHILHNKNQGLKEASTPFFLGSPANNQAEQTQNHNSLFSLAKQSFDMKQDSGQIQIKNQQPRQNIMTFENINYGSFGGSERSIDDSIDNNYQNV